MGGWIIVFRSELFPLPLFLFCLLYWLSFSRLLLLLFFFLASAILHSEAFRVVHVHARCKCCLDGRSSTRETTPVGKCSFRFFRNKVLTAGDVLRSVLDFNPINTIASHMAYWQDEDVSHFVMSQLLSNKVKREKEAK